jgi:hypothetical protein
MTDLVQRLLAMSQGEARSGIGRERRDLFEEAAVEIERLRKELAEERARPKLTIKRVEREPLVLPNET